MLWKDICQNQLLAKTTLILFLNKVRFSVLLVLAPRCACASIHGAPTGRKELSFWTYADV